MKILFLDIETSPNLAYVWGAWKQNISANMFAKHTTLMCWSAKFLGKEEIHFADTSADSEENCLRRLYKLLDEADIVVTHNGKSFDLPVINSRAVVLGIPPASPYRQVDTLLTAKKHFRFTMNSLEYLANILGVTKKSAHKKFPGFELWLECIHNNYNAWEEMKAYNIQDVLTLEQVYLKLLPWMSSHPNVNIDEPIDAPKCNKCGSEDISPRGFAFTKVGKFQRWRCNNCGGWCRSRYSEHTKNERVNILTGVANE